MTALFIRQFNAQFALSVCPDSCFFVTLRGELFGMFNGGASAVVAGKRKWSYRPGDSVSFCARPRPDLVNPTFRTQTVMTPDKRHLRGAVWELPDGATRRGICVLLNGHTEFLEKYGEVADELRARGFVVVSQDWRGQGASERRGYGNRAGHVGSFDEYDSDLAALLLQIVEPMRRASSGAPIPVIGFGHSMGAHVLLRFLHDHPRRFTCAVAASPMLDINTGKYSPATAKLIAFLFNLRKPSTRFIFGVEEHDPLHLSFEENMVTSDRVRFERTKALLSAQPYLRIFGPTFGWLGAAFRSIGRLRRRGFAEDIATPVLMVGAGRDRVVPVAAMREFAKRLPHGRYVEIEDAEHEILMEKDSIRARFWTEFDAFLDANLTR
jgi:lysophospholipase